MEIKKTFNTTIENIRNKEFNIFLPICLGNKFFLNGNSLNQKNITQYIDMALEHTKEKVLFLIADKIQITNYNVRGHSGAKWERYNSKRVLREGKKIKEQLERFIDTNYRKEKNKISVIQWEEYEQEDSFHEKITKLVYREFESNPLFKEEIFIRTKTTMIDRLFEEEQYWEMCNYILDEFSVVTFGINFKKIKYGLFFYPRMDSTAYFIEGIKDGKLFPEFSKKLPKEKVALAILS